MKHQKLIIFGNGGLASVIRVYLENEGVDVAGFTIDESYLEDDEFEGLPNIGFNSIEQYFHPDDHQLFIAIGASDLMGFARQSKMAAGTKKGYELFRYAFPGSHPVNQLNIGENTFIMPGCHVDPFVKLGNGIIAWNGAVICHHTIIGDYSFIAPGATICGQVIIEDHCFIGSNATIRDNLHIANQTLIGAGAAITQDTDPEGVYLPARVSKLDRASINMKFK